MPVDDPTVGEVWETADATGRTIRGIIADVTTSIVTLVSFSGSRYRISPGRMGSWHFTQSPPNTSLRCTRQGCSQPGILRYSRGTMPEWVCPRHLPVGVQATLTTESIGAARPTAPVQEPPIIPAVHCLACGNQDPVEDTRVTLDPGAVLWLCPLCNARWAYVTLGEAHYDEFTYLRDSLDNVRVRLLAENYRIEEILTSSPRTQTLFDVQHRSQSTTPNYLDTITLYEGIPVRQPESNAFGATLGLRLTGGPEFRFRRAAPRPAVLSALVPNIEGRLSDHTRSAIVAGSNYRDTEPRPSVLAGFYRTADPEFVGRGPVRQEIPALGTDMEEQGLVALLEEMAPTPFVSKGSRWRNSSTGDLVEVDHLGQSTEAHEPVVHFRRVSDDMWNGMVLLQRDFEKMFKPFTVERPKGIKEKTTVEVMMGEEWEHIESGATIFIASVDTKRNLVLSEPDGTHKKGRTIPLLDFSNGKWKRLIRRTAYERILEDDDD